MGRRLTAPLETAGKQGNPWTVYRAKLKRFGSFRNEVISETKRILSPLSGFRHLADLWCKMLCFSEAGFKAR